MSQLLDSFNYGIEWFRENVSHPVFDRIVCCFGVIWRFLFSVPYQVKAVAPQLKDEDYCDCLHKSDLSFFNTFVDVNGIPAFRIGQYDAVSSLEDTLPHTQVHAQKDQTGDSEETKPKMKPRSVFESHSIKTVKVCSFSSDGSKLAVCCVSGEVTIWDTDHGTQVEETLIEGGSVSSVSFLGEDNSVLLMCTKDFTVWKWDVDNKDSNLSKIWDRASVPIIKGAMFSQRSSFCNNGTIIVFSTIVSGDGGPLLVVALLDTPIDYDDHKPRYLSTVSIEKNYVISRTTMSSDGKGILVGLLDSTLEDSYCILWPNFVKNPTIYKRLDKGTIGTWSFDTSMLSLGS